MSPDWPKWSEMTWLRLQEGPGHRKILPIAPTMKRLTYKGERYNRMPDTRSALHRGHGCRHFGGSYLWEGWWPQMVAKARAANDPCGGAPVSRVGQPGENSSEEGL